MQVSKKNPNVIQKEYFCPIWIFLLGLAVGLIILVIFLDKDFF